jgi:pimeloyl-ACP methyl ester carboxylesterase
MRTLLTEDGATLAFEVRGHGPALLIPMLNFPWLSMPIVDELAQDFTVIVASPRGFGASTRTGEADYRLDSLKDDLLRVCDEVGAGRFSVFGYSFSTAVGAWLAARTDRVAALIAGAFPLLGHPNPMRAFFDRNVAPIRQDPAALEAMAAQLDFHAVVDFYEWLFSQPADTLANGLRCPVLALWGSEDEVMAITMPSKEQRDGLESRGWTVKLVDGLDHDKMAMSLSSVLPELRQWLAKQSATVL